MASGVFGCSDIYLSASSRRISGPARHSDFRFAWDEIGKSDNETEKGLARGNWRPFHLRFPLATGSRGSRPAPWVLRARSQRRLSPSDRSWLAGILASPAQGRLDPKAIIHAQTLRRRRRTLS